MRICRRRASSSRVAVTVSLLCVLSFIMPGSTGARLSAQTLSPSAAAAEPYRPAYHFTPPSAWMNDPNGLVFFQGEYHLFYQHNPSDTVWGPMHWGHAVSTDLVNWQHLPIALYPDDVGAIFSGSAVVDWNNTSGFGKEAIVAIFTHEKAGRQMQSLAYSIDGGRTWTKYGSNPVIVPPASFKNFRDPKVIWYDEGGGSGHWVMAVAAGNVILFYTSPNLKDWILTGSFGLDYGSKAGVWETPDLFKLPVDGGPEARSVLTVGLGGGAPARGTGVQYFIGNFDGKVFTSENPEKTILWADYGADFYAAQGWNDIPDGRSLWIGWMNNWNYAQEIPTSTWRGATTLPRELALLTTPQGIRLVQQPVPELRSLRDKHWSWRDQDVAPGTNLLAEVTGETLEIVADFQLGQDATDRRVGFRVRVGASEQTTIGYTTEYSTLFVDRTQPGQTAFKPGFAAVHSAEMHPSGDAIRLQIFVDRSSVEVFGNGGQVVFTEQIFPNATSQGVELFVEGGEVRLSALDIYRLKPATFSTADIAASRTGVPPWVLPTAAVVFAILTAGALYLFARQRQHIWGNRSSSNL